MFGYIITNHETLPKERQERFREFYCGLCHTLRQRYGYTGCATLSYDMTFLAVLLNALYEPGETAGKETCLTHPVRAHTYVLSPVMEYVADMNIALAYQKLRDDWMDDHSLTSAAEARLLRAAYDRVQTRWPGKCAAIESWLDGIHKLEAQNCQNVDLPVNATGSMLAELFDDHPEGPMSAELRRVGDGLGRFIYFMDAYEDLPADVRKGRYNPLRTLSQQADYEDVCKSSLMLMAADAADAFERLPILLDADILRNILYSGMWSKYAALQKKRNASKEGAE